MGYPNVQSDRVANFPVIRDSQGEQTNPTTTVVLADTDELGDAAGGTGTYEVLVVASATATAEFVVQLRNRANSVNVGDVHIFYVAANTTVSVPLRYSVESGQRVRVLINTNLTGDAVVSVFAQKVASL